jgi:hypothetical protein
MLAISVKNDMINKSRKSEQTLPSAHEMGKYVTTKNG